MSVSWKKEEYHDFGKLQMISSLMHVLPAFLPSFFFPSHGFLPAWSRLFPDENDRALCETGTFLLALTALRREHRVSYACLLRLLNQTDG